MTTPEAKSGSTKTIAALLAALFPTMPAAAVGSMAACRKCFRFDASV